MMAGAVLYAIALFFFVLTALNFKEIVQNWNEWTYAQRELNSWFTFVLFGLGLLALALGITQ